MKINCLFLFLFVLLVSCSSPEPRRPVVRKTSSFLEESAALNKKLYAEEHKLIQQVMEQDSINTYINSSLGFWYFYQQKNQHQGAFPQKGDEVWFDYEIYDINGNVLYTKEELGTKSYVVDKEDLIRGIQEGVKLMQEGETVTFLLPSYKAFGYRGDEKNKIGINQPIKIKLTLIKIKN